MDLFFLTDAKWLLDPNTPPIFKSPITFIILLITVLISIRAFQDQRTKYQLIFHPYDMKATKQWYRFLSAGFIHADWVHLGLNAFVLYQFGSMVEIIYILKFGDLGRLFYVLLYVLGLVAASLYSYYKHQDNPYYSALGASGAVSGIVFAYILFQPTAQMGIIFIPGIKIPAVILGVAYLVYSSVAGRMGRDNIGHDAHFWGSIWGFVFTLALDYTLLDSFLTDIKGLFS